MTSHPQHHQRRPLSLFVSSNRNHGAFGPLTILHIDRISANDLWILNIFLAVLSTKQETFWFPARGSIGRRSAPWEIKIQKKNGRHSSKVGSSHRRSENEANWSLCTSTCANQWRQCHLLIKSPYMVNGVVALSGVWMRTRRRVRSPGSFSAPPAETTISIVWANNRKSTIDEWSQIRRGRLLLAICELRSPSRPKNSF